MLTTQQGGYVSLRLRPTLYATYVNRNIGPAQTSLVHLNMQVFRVLFLKLRHNRCTYMALIISRHISLNPSDLITHCSVASS